MKAINASLFFALSTFFLLPQLMAQEPVQTIRGQVVDKVSLQPLEGVAVQLENENENPISATITDSVGKYSFSRVETGRYFLKFSRLNYQAQVVQILLNAAKEQVLEISLSERPTALEEVTISAEQSTSRDPLEVNYLSSRIFTVEESQRYAATFYDPARVVAAGPGVVITNDQANHMVVRGNSPNGILWKIEGADVVNPNHLTNAGTMTDKASLTGGGVAILSTQLLGSSKFLSGAFPAGYGNALSGVFDIQLRKGNNQQNEYTAQASLLGIDLAAEGPFSTNYDGSFLVNYRYSTLGLFSAIGIPIGDEIIHFQDISFNLSLPAGTIGDFTVFGIGGNSITTFEGFRDSSKWTYQKDRTDIDFHSNMGVIGVSHTISLNEESGINSVVAFSKNESEREEDYIKSDYSTKLSGKEALSLQKLSFSSYYFQKISDRHKVKFGAVINNNDFKILHHTDLNFNGSLTTLNDVKVNYTLLQPHINWQYIPSSKLLITSGLHLVYGNFNKSFSTEPRLSLKYSLNASSYITAGYGLHSQLQHPATYFNLVEANQKLDFTKAHHYIIGFTKWFNDNISFKSEAYYQQLFDVPVSAESSNSFSALNIIESAIVTDKLENAGTGKNYGVDISLERSMNKSFYFILAGSIYNSLYTGSDHMERNTRFNGNYLARLTTGKEFGMIRKGNKNVFGINLNVNQIGGLRYTPINEADTELLESNIYNTSNSFSEQLDDFFRIDVRFIWRKNKAKYTRTLALDIQNLSNNENPAYYYYDKVHKSIVVKNQLGIIPFISYRVEF